MYISQLLEANQNSSRKCTSSKEDYNVEATIYTRENEIREN